MVPFRFPFIQLEAAGLLLWPTQSGRDTDAASTPKTFEPNWCTSLAFHLLFLSTVRPKVPPPDGGVAVDFFAPWRFFLASGRICGTCHALGVGSLKSSWDPGGAKPHILGVQFPLQYTPQAHGRPTQPAQTVLLRVTPKMAGRCHGKGSDGYTRVLELHGNLKKHSGKINMQKLALQVGVVTHASCCFLLAKLDVVPACCFCRVESRTGLQRLCIPLTPSPEAQSAWTLESLAMQATWKPTHGPLKELFVGDLM